MSSLPSPSAPARGDGHTGPVPTLTSPRLHRPLGPEPTVLVVGYPAPAAVQIVDRLLATDARTIACVVPRDRRAEAAGLHPGARGTGRLRLFEGAADAPGLGLPRSAWRVLDTADEIFAVASPREIAAGHLQDFADECPQLRELHLVSPHPAERDARSASTWAAVRRLRRSLLSRVPTRTSGTLASALAAAGAALAAPFVRAAGTWKDALDIDIEAAFSWEDLQRDLQPGVRPVG